MRSPQQHGRQSRWRRALSPFAASTTSSSLLRSTLFAISSTRCPIPSFPFLGVHFTRLIHGGIEAGPNAVLAFAREGYRHTDFRLRDTLETLTYPGFWRFLLRYPSMCWHEFHRSFSKALFCRSLQRLVPELQLDDLMEGGAGVRAQALSPLRRAGAGFLLRTPGNCSARA